MTSMDAYKKSKYIPVGVFNYKDKIVILERYSLKGSDFNLSLSSDGVTFKHDDKEVSFINGLITHKPEQCSNFRFSYFGNKILATYTRKVGAKIYSVIAETKNAYNWEVLSEKKSAGHESVILEEHKVDLTFKKHGNNYVMYEGGAFIKCLISEDLEKWNDNDSLLFTTRAGSFDKNNINLIASFLSEKGIVLLYESIEYVDNNYRQNVGMVIFDKKDPYKIIWRSQDPLWKGNTLFSKDTDSRFVGITVDGNQLCFYWSTDNNILTICLDDFLNIVSIYKAPKKVLIRHAKNPILTPHSVHEWESEAVFNPATLTDDNGHVHLLYRAVGSDGVSRLGYDFSEDGINFNGRLTYPVFAMKSPKSDTKDTLKSYDVKMYPSGGSWGGCEDPRMVRIDGKIYITFNAFDGWDYIRIGVVSIDEKDFFEKKWKWSKPLLISPPNQINKNWVIFPEKINGKFAILHSISPKVMIDYIDDLNHLDKNKNTIKSHFAQDKTRASWDTWVRGVGPPPLKTKQGWLVLYHGMDHRDPNKYKLGAMLLDLKNPSKIIGRATEPLLMPDMWYENDSKPGVVYACGAIIKNDTLFVYYGGGDKHVCVATSPLEKVLSKLTKNIK